MEILNFYHSIENFCSSYLDKHEDFHLFTTLQPKEIFSGWPGKKKEDSQTKEEKNPSVATLLPEMGKIRKMSNTEKTRLKMRHFLHP